MKWTRLGPVLFGALVVACLAMTAAALVGAAGDGRSDLPNKAFAGNVASDDPKAPPSPSSTASGGFQVAFLDVGEGDSILVTVGDHRLLIDGGRSDTLALQRLQSRGVANVEAIVATHPDADHIGGLAAVLGAYQVTRIYVSGDSSTTDTYAGFIAAATAEPGAEIITATRGQTVALGDLLLSVLNPTSATGDTNNDSVVLRLGCGSVSVLFTGDAEMPAERAMMSAGLATPVTVLKVGHHGSNSSSSLAFLQSLRPQVSVISAGRTNAYGHPAAETIARLASVGSLFEYTDTTAGDDSVTMTSDCSSYSFSTPPTSGGVGSVTASPTATIVPPTATATATSIPPPVPIGDDKGPWYTSSFSTSTYYYCAADPGWRGLSPTYLRSYSTEAALLSDWAGRRIKHAYPGC